jgi:hypothetical protein
MVDEPLSGSGFRSLEEGPPPEWDDEWAKWLQGQYTLIGITLYEPDGTTLRSVSQYHGRIIEVKQDGVLIACEGVWEGQTVNVPPDQRAFTPAKPGRYTLKSTGEMIDDPDVLTTWAITASS